MKPIFQIKNAINSRTIASIAIQLRWPVASLLFAPALRWYVLSLPFGGISPRSLPQSNAVSASDVPESITTDLCRVPGTFHRALGIRNLVCVLIQVRGAPALASVFKARVLAVSAKLEARLDGHGIGGILRRTWVSLRRALDGIMADGEIDTIVPPERARVFPTLASPVVSL